MGLEKLMNDSDEIKITQKSYKDKVDNELKTKFEKHILVSSGINLLDMEEEKAVKKTAISVYFKDEDLNLLKAISQAKNTTVNKAIMNIFLPFLLNFIAVNIVSVVLPTPPLTLKKLTIFNVITSFIL